MGSLLYCMLKPVQMEVPCVCAICLGLNKDEGYGNPNI